MNSLGEIEEHILSEMVVKKRLVMNDIEMVIDEFLLDCSVIAFNNAVDLRTPGIDEQMGDSCFLQCPIKFSEIL
jgi:hypothetical protein